MIAILIIGIAFFLFGFLVMIKVVPMKYLVKNREAKRFEHIYSSLVYIGLGIGFALLYYGRIIGKEYIFYIANGLVAVTIVYSFYVSILNKR